MGQVLACQNSFSETLDLRVRYTDGKKLCAPLYPGEIFLVVIAQPIEKLRLLDCRGNVLFNLADACEGPALEVVLLIDASGHVASQVVCVNSPLPASRTASRDLLRTMLPTEEYC